MVNRSKNIGTAAETATARWLQANGIPAERLPLYGSMDRGDLASPGVCWEVKSGAAAKTASDGQVEKWLDETERERVYANAVYGVLVMARAGIGPARAGEWWAVMTAETFADLLHEACFDEDGTSTMPEIVYGRPIRIHLATACALLRQAGYGDPFTDTPTEGAIAA